MRNLHIWIAIGFALQLSGCACMRPTKPAEGVAIEKVINQIKQDLTKSSVANIIVGDGSINACGDEKKPLTLIRDEATPPVVTLKLQTVRTVDVTTDAGVSKLPVLGILFSADASYEYKRQNTVEQDLAFIVLRESVGGHSLIAPVKPADYSTLGKEIDEAETAILKADHTARPCLRPSKLSVNVVVDVTKTVAVNGAIGFALLYSVSIKNVHSNEQKNTIVVDLTYSPKTGAALTYN
jgi:hypothetical protein